MAKSQRPTHTADFIKAETREAVFLGNPLMDNMMTALIALGGEVWSGRRRQHIVESLLESEGAVTEAMIEAYKPSKEQEAAWAAERDEFIQRVYGVFTRQTSSGNE